MSTMLAVVPVLPCATINEAGLEFLGELGVEDTPWTYHTSTVLQRTSVHIHKDSL
jgi:hypothetical protein